MSGAAALVTGLAAETSLGNSVAACAAARAGLMRSTALDQDAFDPEEGPTPLLGHMVPTVSGFQGEARLLALGLAPLLELVALAALQSGEKIGVFLALPDLKARAEILQRPAPPALSLADRLTKMAGLSGHDAATQIVSAGQAGFALALDLAMQSVEQGKNDACVVGGVDSHCDDLALDALAAQDALKTGTNPTGLQPGEAAALLLLESPARARRRGASALARVTGVGTGREARVGDRAPIGEGLAQALGALIAAAGPLPPRQTWFVLDRNGEVWRASDWGYCQLWLVRNQPGLLPAHLWDPATNFGDTGAASGALAVQMVIRSFTRGYAPGQCAVVVSSSASGERAAVRIENVS